MTALTLEDLATTSDHTAVRRRYDGRNLAWLTVLGVVFLLVNSVLVLAGLFGHVAIRAVVAAANVALVLLVLFAVRTRSSTLSVVLARHVSAAVIGYMVAQYVMAITTAGNEWPAWVFIFPLLMLPFRMLVSELVLVHAAFFTIAAGVGLFSNRPNQVE